jgi:uncharacterized protein (TIGR02271 family)
MEPNRESEERIVVPLHEEEVSVTKRDVETGRVRVSTVTREHEQLIDELLSQETVEVERTPVSKLVAAIPAVREEGDTIIVPIVEEILVIERRLMLKEEVRIRRVRGTTRHQERVVLKKQEAVVTRVPVETPETAGAVPGNDSSKG